MGVTESDFPVVWREEEVCEEGVAVHSGFRVVNSEYACYREAGVDEGRCAVVGGCPVRVVYICDMKSLANPWGSCDGLQVFGLALLEENNGCCRWGA